MQLSIKEKNRLKNKYGQWALVTGASSGIGLELASQLAAAGFQLVMVSRQAEKLQVISNDLRSKFSVEIKSIDTDLSSAGSIEKIITDTSELDIGLLVNAAGFGTSGLFSEASLPDEINMLRVNCEAVLCLTHHFIQRFRSRQSGGIIFLSSLVAFQGVPYSSHYAATKAYIQSFAEALTIELQPNGIDVLAAAPGPVDSGFARRANMKMGKALQPSAIAVPILKALGRQSTVIPGLLSKVLVYSLRTVPRWAKVRIMQKVMGGFTAHQRQS
ncbi:MAG: SDR family NAD(P)-dependent oxidoreductase [Terrimonas sp.]|nr:SDR family NAD(P)-dependent oxidoreductase [Terrimonas sp.]